MLNKNIEKIYKEPFLSEAGVCFNTNDSMIATGNSNGDLIVRNLLNPQGDPINSNLDIQTDDIHESGIKEVILSHFVGH